jgi:UDP-N-acetylglucosamine--N-acetylmuramyl-(pentapeptide) pyrophosphoryl-undecaprenol N-acetylglucosamine transferase
MSVHDAPRVLFAGGGTGGHLYPAIALARQLQEQLGAEVFFVGARRGVEARVLPERNVPHQLLPFEPIRRSRPWENVRLVPALGAAMVGIARLFREFQPQLVVGTGGYASGPVVAWAVLRGVPTAIQEQNSYPGLTTRLLARRVRQLHLAFPESLTYLRPGRNTEVFELGNPIEPPDRSIAREEAHATFGLGGGRVALIIGGSQGSRAVNEALLRDLEAVSRGGGHTRPEGLELLWATGPAHFEEIAGRVQALGLSGWVHPQGYIHQMPHALAAADVAVSRAGAMALAELCAWGIPSVLVPLPTAAANHQYHNARALSDAGAATLLPESELAPGRLWSELVALTGDEARRSGMAARALERGQPNAAAKIVEHLGRLL